jgi:hypothetical protein
MMIINDFQAIIWLVYVILGWICCQGVMKISNDLTFLQAKILPDDIHRAKQFHAHPYHHLLICLDDDNQWCWSYHLVHVRHAGSDLWSGCDESQQ